MPGCSFPGKPWTSCGAAGAEVGAVGAPGWHRAARSGLGGGPVVGAGKGGRREHPVGPVCPVEMPKAVKEVRLEGGRARGKSSIRQAHRPSRNVSLTLAGVGRGTGFCLETQWLL